MFVATLSLSSHLLFARSHATNYAAAEAMNGLQLLASWLTPTVLFCILNLMIGTIFVVSSLKPGNKQPKVGDNGNADESPPQLVRIPSLFERVNSIKLSLYRSEKHEPVSAPAHLNIPNQEQTHKKSETGYKESQVSRSKSDTGAKVSPSSTTVTVMKKSASEKVEDRQKLDQETMTRENIEATGGGDDEAVDARADDFINRFRQQLKLQRLDSLLRYKEMLKKGGQ